MLTLVDIVFIEPSVFELPEPFAFQFQDTSVPVFTCPPADACSLTVNPSDPNAVTP